MRLREESNLKNTIEIPTDNPYYQKQSFYGWTPFHSKYAFNEERTDKYSPYADIFRNIASNGIVGDIIHFGGGYTNGFLTMAVEYGAAIVILIVSSLIFLIYKNFNKENKVQLVLIVSLVSQNLTNDFIKQIDELLKAAQNSGPVKNFDAQFEKLKLQ